MKNYHVLAAAVWHQMTVTQTPYVMGRVIRPLIDLSHDPLVLYRDRLPSLLPTSPNGSNQSSQETVPTVPARSL